eukprot:g17136.t1
MARSATPDAARLLQSVRQRNEAGVEKALAAGCSIDGSSEQDWRPLLAAAASGKVSMTEFLIAKGANLDLGSLDDLRCSDGLEVLGKGVRALHVAINHYHLDVFRALLKAGADPDSANGKGLTPLMLTCILEDPGRGAERAIMARELLKAGADPALADFQGKTALGFAAARSQIELIDILLLRAPTTLNRATPDGLTPLYAAAMSGKDEAVAHLLKAGAQQPPASAQKDMCPLVAAVRENHRKVIEVLLSDQGMRAIGGSAAIPQAMGAAAAARKGRAGIVQMLLLAEGEERQRHWARCCYKEDPVLHCAVSFGNMSAARVLLTAGADETAENDEGRWARDVIGFNAPSLQRDPAKKGAIVRMLERGPAFRARSFLWPPGIEDSGSAAAAAGAAAAVAGGGDAHAGGDAEDACANDARGNDACAAAAGAGDTCAADDGGGGEVSAAGAAAAGGGCADGDGGACACREGREDDVAAAEACTDGDGRGGDEVNSSPSATPKTPLGVRIYRAKNKAFLVRGVSRYALLGAKSRVDNTGAMVLR